MLNKRAILTDHVLDQMIKRNFSKQTDREKIRKMVTKDLKPLSIKRVEKTMQADGKLLYKVWVHGGRQYRLKEKGSVLIVVTGLQLNRQSNKYANIK